MQIAAKWLGPDWRPAFRGLFEHRMNKEMSGVQLLWTAAPETEAANATTIGRPSGVVNGLAMRGPYVMQTSLGIEAAELASSRYGSKTMRYPRRRCLP